MLRSAAGTVTNINGSGNPFGNQEDYLNIIDGYIYIDALGNYQFAVDFDDAVELLINGNVVSGWHGGHGAFAEGSQPNPAFNTTLALNITVIDDPVNGTTLPKSIPGATAIYTLDITNSGNRSPDVNSLIISDAIPSNVELFVDNYDGTGQSVKLTDTNNGGLTLNASGIRYSAKSDPSCSDNYTPDSTGGYDANVSYLCITPDGVMNFDELAASRYNR